MNRFIISAVVVAALASSVPVDSADARGFIKGAVVGGIADHSVDHGVLSAVASRRSIDDTVHPMNVITDIF